MDKRRAFHSPNKEKGHKHLGLGTISLLPEEAIGLLHAVLPAFLGKRPF
jgi:hypothetical protein